MILVLAGAIGSGKSTLAAALAAALGAPRAGFGDYVRHLAAGLGLDTTNRTVLQDIGHERVETDARAFLDDTLAWSGHQPGAVLVLEGLRHVKILEALQARAAELEDPVILVYLDTPPEVRGARVTAARGVSGDQLRKDEQHPAELDLYERLKAAADLVLSATDTIEAQAQQVLFLLSRR